MLWYCDSLKCIGIRPLEVGMSRLIECSQGVSPGLIECTCNYISAIVVLIVIYVLIKIIVLILL